MDTLMRIMSFVSEAWASLTVVFIILFIFYTKLIRPAFREAITDYADNLFDNKDYPIKETIKKGKFIKIYLYNLTYKNNDNETVDRDSLMYLHVAEIVNKNVKIDLDEKLGELTLDLTDFELEENKFIMMELIQMVTNFNYGQFVFKGEDRLKLFTEESKLKEKMIDHVNEIVNVVFNDYASLLDEEGLQDILDKHTTKN